MMKKYRMIKKYRSAGKYQKLKTAVNGTALSAALAMSYGMQAFAAGEDGAAVVTNGFSIIIGIVSAIVSSIGTLLLLWGLFEWAMALNTQDGGAQSMAFKRVGSGIVAVLGPQILPLITAAMSAGR